MSSLFSRLKSLKDLNPISASRRSSDATVNVSDEPPANNNNEQPNPNIVLYNPLEIPSWWTGSTKFRSVNIDGYICHGSMDPKLALAIAKIEHKWKWPNSASYRVEVTPIVLQHALWMNVSPEQKKRLKAPKLPPKSYEKYRQQLRQSGWTNYAGKGMDLELWMLEGCKDKEFKSWLHTKKRFGVDKMGVFVIAEDLGYTTKGIIPYNADGEDKEEYQMRMGLDPIYYKVSNIDDENGMENSLPPLLPTRRRLSSF